ncbi:MAG: HEAT repeat domain-containing protein [Myxococcota bacterium]
MIARLGGRRFRWAAFALLLPIVGCDEGDADEEPVEEELEPEEDASEGKTAESEYNPTDFCLENGAINNGPNVGPAALGDTVLGTSGRADGFGNESWGAAYGAELSLKGVSGGPNGAETLIRGELVGTATVFDFSADVVRVVLEGASTANGMTGFDASLTVLDRFTYPLFDYDANFSDEQHFSAPLFTATTGVPLIPGLAPVELNASVVGQLGYLLSGQILPKGIAILVRPEASLLVTATASVDAGIAAARAEGQIQLLNLSVPIQVALTFDDTAGIRFDWDVRVDMDADWLAGDIEVIADAFGEERYRKAIAEWEGWHLSTTHLSDGAGEIFPGAPGECGAAMLERDHGVLDRVDFAPIADTSLPPRMPQLVAMGYEEVPALADIAVLTEEFRQPQSRTRSTAGFALGTALSHLQPYEPVRVTEAVDELASQYDAATDDDERVLLLRILGNAGSDRTLPLVEGALAASQEDVRVAAVQALRHVKSDAADELLADVMTGTDGSIVRAAAVRTAAARRSARSDAAIADLLTVERDDWVQIAGLHAMGRAATRSEDAAAALRWLHTHARLKQVRDVAGNYLHQVAARGAR